MLVVEDDESLRDLFARMLERAGLTVMKAVNGREGLERIRERAVDLVVTDMLMPVMDGIELMRALIVECPRTPIIAVSGVEEWAEYLRIATHLGAKAALRKPVTAARLVQAVRDVLANPSAAVVEVDSSLRRAG